MTSTRAFHPVATRHAVGSLRPSSYEGLECEILSVSMFAVALEVSTTWAVIEVRPTGDEPNVKMNDHVTPEIAFKNFWSVEGSLTEISSEVAAIIERFEPVFS